MAQPLPPSVLKLISYRMSLIAIPKGSKDPFTAGARAILEEGRLAQIGHEATEWTKAAIHLIRNAAEPNPWKESTDEDIAADILRKVEERSRREKRP